MHFQAKDQGYGHPFPDPAQLLLLKAALCEGEEAILAWQAWQQAFDLKDPLDAGSYRTLPLLYRNLSRVLPQEPLLPKLKAAYRQSWYRNQQVLHRGLPALRLLRGAGIEVMLLKGAALGPLWYGDAGVRPMADLDVMVCPADACRALDLLKEAGWTPEEPGAVEYNLRYGRAMGLRDAEGWELDLHWHALFEGLRHEGVDLWRNAAPMELQDLTVKVPEHAMMLVHVMVHGLRWNPEPPIRWIPDSLQVMRAMGAGDWERVTELVRAYRIQLPMLQALGYLKQHFGAEVPEHIHLALSNMSTGYAERALWKAQLRPGAERLPEAFFPRLHYLFGVYMRQSGRSGLLPNLAGFPAFLAYRTRGKSRLQLLAYYAGRAWRGRRKDTAHPHPNTP
ncbi:MAG TPA: nucleotidyltransferase family protein [Bacteroidales bacterium]|nr:nucleotidyltransferase family protein [Bacteroidales bacterium]